MLNAESDQQVYNFLPMVDKRVLEQFFRRGLTTLYQVRNKITHWFIISPDIFFDCVVQSTYTTMTMCDLQVIMSNFVLVEKIPPPPSSLAMSRQPNTEKNNDKGS